MTIPREAFPDGIIVQGIGGQDVRATLGASERTEASGKLGGVGAARTHAVEQLPFLEAQSPQLRPLQGVGVGGGQVLARQDGHRGPHHHITACRAAVTRVREAGVFHDAGQGIDPAVVDEHRVLHLEGIDLDDAAHAMDHVLFPSISLLQVIPNVFHHVHLQSSVKEGPSYTRWQLKGRVTVVISLCITKHEMKSINCVV